MMLCRLLCKLLCDCLTIQSNASAKQNDARLMSTIYASYWYLAALGRQFTVGTMTEKIDRHNVMM